MKKFMSAICATLVCGAITVNAQVSGDTTGTSNMNNYSTQQDDRVEIRSSELPDRVRTTLEGNDYEGWNVGKAYRSRNNDGYWVEMNDGTNSRTYHFDRDGNLMDDGMNDQGTIDNRTGTGTGTGTGTDDGRTGTGTGTGTGSSGTGTGTGTGGTGTGRP